MRKMFHLIRRTLPIVLIVGFILIGACSKKKKKLLVFSCEAVIKPLQDIRAVFENRHNIKIDLIFEDLNTLLEIINETRRGDAIVSLTEEFEKKVAHVVDNHQYIASVDFVIAVHKDNPKNIESFNDLSKDNIKIVISDPFRSTFERMAEKTTINNKLKEKLMKNVSIFTPYCLNVADLLIKKEADAGIIIRQFLYWPEYKDLKSIEISKEKRETKEVHIAVLKTSKDKEATQLFADFLATEGKSIFKRYGFTEK